MFKSRRRNQYKLSTSTSTFTTSPSPYHHLRLSSASANLEKGRPHMIYILYPYQLLLDLLTPPSLTYSQLLHSLTHTYYHHLRLPSASGTQGTNIRIYIFAYEYPYQPLLDLSDLSTHPSLTHSLTHSLTFTTITSAYPPRA